MEQLQTGKQIMIDNHKHHSPLPWSYHSCASSSTASGRNDWIEDVNGDIVVNHIGYIDGPLIVECVNNFRAQKSERDTLKEIAENRGRTIEHLIKATNALLDNYDSAFCAVEDGKYDEAEEWIGAAKLLAKNVLSNTSLLGNESPWLPIKDAPKDSTHALESDLYKFVDFINQTYFPDTAGPEGWGEYQQGIIELAKELNDCRNSPKSTKSLVGVNP